MSKHKNNGKEQIKQQPQRVWCKEMECRCSRLLSFIGSHSCCYWGAILGSCKKPKVSDHQMQEKARLGPQHNRKKATGLLSTIKTGELQSKTEVFPTSPLTSQLPGCTQVPCLTLKPAVINTESSVTSVHTKCHCSGLWLQLWVPGVWEAIFIWWQNALLKLKTVQ